MGSGLPGSLPSYILYYLLCIFSSLANKVVVVVVVGAMVTCMPLSMLKESGMDQKDLMPSTAQLRGVTGTDLQLSLIHI